MLWMKWKIGGKGIGFRRERKGKSGKMRNRGLVSFLIVKGSEVGSFLEGLGSDRARISPNRNTDEPSDLSGLEWIRARIYGSAVGSVWAFRIRARILVSLQQIAETAIFSNFFSLFRPIPNYTLDKLFINSNLPRTCNIP